MPVDVTLGGAAPFWSAATMGSSSATGFLLPLLHGTNLRWPESLLGAPGALVGEMNGVGVEHPSISR